MPTVPAIPFRTSAAITKRSLAGGHVHRILTAAHRTNDGGPKMDDKSLLSRYVDVHEALFSWTFTVVRSTWTFPCLYLTEVFRSLSAFAIPMGSRSGTVLPFTPRTRSAFSRLRRRQEEDSAQDAARGGNDWSRTAPGELQDDAELSTGSASPRGFDKLPPEDEGN